MRQSQCRLHRQASTAELDSESPCDRASSFALTSRSRYRAQTLPKSQLGECHGAILFRARERPHAVVATVALHQAREGAPRQKVHKLSEQRLANVHGRPLETPGKCAESVQIDTAPKMVKNPCKPRAYSNLIDRLTGQQ